MKTTTRSLSTAAALAALLLALVLSACGTKPTAPTGPTAPAAPSAPAQPVWTASSTASAPAPAAQPAGADPQGDADLEQPGQGLDALPGYRQTLEITLRGTLDGSPYEETQRIERQVTGADGALRVTSSATGGQPVSLFDAFVDGYHYSQEREAASCRAEPVDDSTAAHPNLALRLPTTVGMAETGRGMRSGVAAVQYSFDQTSLAALDGTLRAASGEAWIAQEGGAVLGYTLTAEIDTGSFRGTRSWVYTLEPGAAVQLPAACQPVLAGLPALPGAADTTNLPGFQRYYASASSAEAVAFYYDQLTALGWQALPGSAPDQADLESEATVVSYAQPYGDGGRVLVIQLAESNGRLQVVLQSALTRQPVQSNVSGAPIDAETETEEEPQPPEDASQPLLPDDLPEYPGATVVTRMDNFIMLNISAGAETVKEFYVEALTAAGWKLEQDVQSAGMTMLRWSRDGQSLMLNLLPQGSTLQVTITAVE